MYFVGFNASEGIEEAVVSWVVENELGGDEDQWKRTVGAFLGSHQ